MRSAECRVQSADFAILQNRQICEKANFTNFVFCYPHSEWGRRGGSPRPPPPPKLSLSFSEKRVLAEAQKKR